MKIFITGATGFIGFPVAQAFRRAGHEVFGLARTDAKAAELSRNEIHPVIGTLQAPASYLVAAEACSVLVHAASDAKADTLAVDRSTVEALISAGKKGASPKTLIYTSGVWLYGDTGDAMVDETATLNPVSLVARRAETERMVLAAAGLRGLSMRPGCVYGYGGSLTAMWFAGASSGKLEVVGDGHNRWAMVHGDDLADAYVRAAESGLSGEAFNVTDRSRSPVRRMVTAAARAAGFKGDIRYVPLEEARKAMGPFADALALDQHADSRKAVRLLGWQPRHGGFVDEVDTYYASWKASQG
jgi:nucleoside-diphosphate-sugar epimerase